MTKHLSLGKLGEDIACRFLIRKGFHVKTRNYRKIYGEIDIIAQKNKKLYFIEVKSLSFDISRETKTGEYAFFKPEDAVHYKKRERLKRAIQGYLSEKQTLSEMEWQFDIVSVLIDVKNKNARVRFLENLTL